MCGITGIYNLQNSLSIALDILENQATRGKDATGIAYIQNNKLIVKKEAVEPKIFKGKYSRLFKKLSDVTICIGHNRLASVNVQEKHKNSEAHPFISEDGTFALVHNGTFINYEYLANLVDILGHNRASGVDSEIFVHILEEILKKYDRDTAIKKFHSLSEGNILVLFSDGTLYGIPSHAFVLIQINNGYIIASGIDYITNILSRFANENTEIKCYIPEEDTTLLKLWKEDDKVKCLLFGKWEEETIAYKDWIGVARRSCEFCDSTRTICEKIEIDKKTYYRCLNCYKNNNTTPKKQTYTYNDWAEFYPYKYPNLCGEPTIKCIEVTRDERGQCQECFVFKPLRELILCTKCNKHFCLMDIANHSCKGEDKS
ncbi:MAG: hypothetical protein QXK24_00025 [Ignisphaera sp.]